VIRARCAVLAAAITALLVLGVTALASASQPSSTVEPTLEAWYQPDPTCASPIGCVTQAVPVTAPVEIPASSPYPAGTLHVGWASSAETARSYLTFPVAAFGPVESAVLTVPLDVDPNSGDVQSSTAQVRACLATGDLMDVEGSISAPPSVDCTFNVVLTYAAAPAPHLIGDLEPLLTGLSTSPGIALLPVASESPSTAWHITFSAHDRADDAKTPPASLRLTGQAEPTTTVAPVAGLGAPTSPAPPDAPLAPIEEPSAFEPTADIVEPRTTLTSPPIAVPRAATAAPAALVTQTFGYAYPGLWLLPLALLVAVPVVARALTKNLEPSP
jgi:hypothetical protein